MANQEKLSGNAEYKKRNFPKALEYYQKAIELDPTEMIYYLNAAAALLEQNELDESIRMCLEALKVGESNNTSFKNIAKAYVRAGNAYYKKGDLQKAKDSYDNSLLNERNSEIVSKVYQIDREIREKESKAYQDPELSKQEKEKGNALFREGDFPKAIEHYTEAIKRLPTDARLYSNRAGCYANLLAYPTALNDCDKATSLDPTFVKPFLRKGAIHVTMKEIYKARKAFEKALEIDPKCSEAINGLKNCSLSDTGNAEEIRQQAMNDPEIQTILSDPAMRLILEQAQNDPSSLAAHLKDPNIASKFEKLVKSGIVGVK